MMSIFGTPFYTTRAAPEPSFTSLFRLLDEFDSYAQDSQCQPRHRPRRPVPTFKPRFDARETEDSYELHGELPGIERDNLNIEFTDAQTLVVSGRVVRKYEKKQPSPPQQTEAAQTETEKTPVHNNSHHATVEDDPEDDSISIVSTPSSSSATASKAEVTKPVPASTPAPAPASGEKVLMYERSIGQFSRTFEFPGRIDQDAVSATLDNGVLTVVVPKVKTPATRRITIN